MNNMITDSMNVVMFVVKVDGVEKSIRFSHRTMAEMAMDNLPEDQKQLAEVHTITTDGKELLLG